MSIRKDPTRAKDAAASPANGFSERLTVGILIVITAFLAFVRFVLLPNQEQGEAIPFHYQNPMLTAEKGDCVRGKGSTQPGTERCFVVLQRVERPRKGPERLPGNPDLRSALPYLAVSMREAEQEPGGCGASDSEQEVIVYPLNGFGMPARSDVRVDTIRPLWKTWGGREHFVYEVVFQRFGRLAGTWITYVSKDAPVTGVVKSEFAVGGRPPEEAVYREVTDCPR